MQNNLEYQIGVTRKIILQSARWDFAQIFVKEARYQSAKGEPAH